MREREKGPDTYFKALKLVDPEKAQGLGYKAEGPVFVSPDITQRKKCETCGATYTPLVYQAGFVVESQHFHQEGDAGGIYYVDGYGLPYDFSYINSPVPWIAIVDPLGRREQWRSEAVLVQRMKALCIDNRCRLELNGGVVVSFPAPTRPHELFPLCSLDTHPQVTLREEFEVNPNGRWHSERFGIREISLPPQALFTFKITPDGRVVFGNLREFR